MSFLRLLLAATSVIGVAAASASCDKDLSVRVNGGVVHGTVDKATPGVRQFLGIPYAQPPIDDLRFAPPQPALSFGEFNATEMPPSCMQYPITGPSIATYDVLEFNIGGLNATAGPISEDCLTLSVWAPRNKDSKAKLPVLVFFYGGGFATGGIDVPYQLPAEWVERTQDHVVVSFNYRGNIFGFPNAAGLAEEEQNVGLLDQRLALEWLRDNVAAFGGDPERMGAWGASSGACSIAYYSYSYSEDPIVNSLIMNSGNEFIDVLTRDPAHGNFTYVASQLGCGDLSADEELACMRKVDAAAIEDLLQEYAEAGTMPPLTFSPIIENRTIFDDYTTLAAEGKMAKLPTLLGTTRHDGVGFVPYAFDGVDEAAAEAFTWSFFYCPAYESARGRIAAGAGPVYRFLYAGNFTNVSPRWWLGAYHGAELPLLFGTHPLYRGDSSQLEWETSYAMQDAWLAFVATAGEAMPIAGWDAWDQVAGGQVVEFGNGVPARLLDTTPIEKEWCL